MLKNPVREFLKAFEKVVNKSSEETRDAEIDYLGTDVRGVLLMQQRPGNTSRPMMVSGIPRFREGTIEKSHLMLVLLEI